MPKNFAETVKDISAILQNHNPNIILYGPPGTGKTYMAKEIAKYVLLKRINIMIVSFDGYWNDISRSEYKCKDNKAFFTIDYINKKINNNNPGNDFNELAKYFTIFLKKEIKEDNFISEGFVGYISDLSVNDVNINDTVEKQAVCFYPTIICRLSDDIIKQINRSRLKELTMKKGQNFYNGWYVIEYLDILTIDDLGVLIENILKCFINTHINIIQFHPAYNYDDLVKGISVKVHKNNIIYEYTWKILGEMSRKALVSIVNRKNLPKYQYISFSCGCEEKSSKKEEKIYEISKNIWIKASKSQRERWIKEAPPYILIIDEINRANLPAVLGELIYALEYRGEPVKTLYGDELIIPPNLYIIGTMNTADRSAGRIDYAIRRRFAFYQMPAKPDPGVVSDYGQKLMEAVNGFIEKNVSPDYDPEDIKIGHTYFMGNKERINYKFLYQVVPLLYEYVQDGLVKAVKEDKGYKIRLNGRDYFLRGGRLYDSNGNIVEDPKVIVQ